MKNDISIETWLGRIRSSEKQGWVKERVEVRRKLTEWFESKFWGTLALLGREKDLKQREIGAILGVSQMHVSRLLRQSLEQLQAVAAAEAQQA